MVVERKWSGRWKCSKSVVVEAQSREEKEVVLTKPVIVEKEVVREV